MSQMAPRENLKLAPGALPHPRNSRQLPFPDDVAVAVDVDPYQLL